MNVIVGVIFNVFKHRNAVYAKPIISLERFANNCNPFYRTLNRLHIDNSTSKKKDDKESSSTAAKRKRNESLNSDKSTG